MRGTIKRISPVNWKTTVKTIAAWLAGRKKAVAAALLVLVYARVVFEADSAWIAWASPLIGGSLLLSEPPPGLFPLSHEAAEATSQALAFSLVALVVVLALPAVVAFLPVVIRRARLSVRMDRIRLWLAERGAKG